MATNTRTLALQAQRHLNRGDYAALAACCKAILNEDWEFADAWFLLSIAAEAAGDIPDALQLRTHALALAPGNAEYLAQQARLLCRCHRSREALAAARAGVAADPKNALTLDTLGVVLSRLGRHTEAADTLRRAVQSAPGNAQYHFNLASAAQFMGNVGEAERHYRAALELRPGFARACWALSELRKSAEIVMDVSALEAQLADQGTTAQDALYLGHVLATEHECRGDNAATFAALSRAKACYRERALASRPRDEALFDALQACFKEPDTAPRQRHQDVHTPLFVVGMPRTGTTLAERILSRHPAVHSLGETADLCMAIRRSAGMSATAAITDPAIIAAALAAPHVSLSRAYLNASAARLESLPVGGSYLLDKTPLNARYIGLILRSMPEARIVILRRDPRDTCLSNYRQLFALDSTDHEYHYDLETTAWYVARFERLMAHWLSIYGKRVHALSYEQLVEDPEREVRALLGYLNLSWNADCLSFERSTAGVATASALQVRRPLYRDGLDRWRRFETELAPAIAILNEAGATARSLA